MAMGLGFEFYSTGSKEGYEHETPTWGARLRPVLRRMHALCGEGVFRDWSLAYQNAF